MKQVFLAISIANTTEISSYISHYQKDFGFMQMVWKNPDFLHLTLKFFGPTSEKRIEKVKNILAKLFEKQQKFNLTISKISIFGSKHSPSLLWWGIKEEAEIHDLANKIKEELSLIGIKADGQNFVPHITLARIGEVNSKPFFQKQIDKNNKDLEIKLPVIKIDLIETLNTKDNKMTSYNILESFYFI